MTLVIISGGIDLSAASNIALSSVITAYADQRRPAAPRWPSSSAF